VNNGGYNYDGAGNMTYDGKNSYAYDGEGRICAVKTVAGSYFQYIYDADGNRIAKGSVNSLSCNTSSNGFTLVAGYVVGASGEQVSELDGQGQWVRSNVYADGQPVATYTSSGVHFHMTDEVGTRRVQVSGGLSAYQAYLSLPFGNV